MTKVKENFWHKNTKYTVGSTFSGNITDEIKQYLEEEKVTKETDQQPKRITKKRRTPKAARSKRK